jgi:DNA-directed RNA polymerase sigma subunit (sigma70/sigma32)
MGSFESQSGHRFSWEVWDRQPSGEELAESEEEWVIAVRRMASLEVRERNVLALRFGIGGDVLPLAEIGRRYSLTPGQARGIVKGALRKLRSLP